jgi:hypothetical protein
LPLAFALARLTLGFLALSGAFAATLRVFFFAATRGDVLAFFFFLAAMGVSKVTPFCTPRAGHTGLPWADRPSR